ncbi:MAG: BspA family leucine-rich repeat surface protein, partial [Muribaculaceae bacterium]
MRKFFTKTCIALLMALFLFPVGAKAQEAYAVENGEELTFYYDNNSSSRSGTIYSMPTGLTENPGWQDNGNIKKAVFDASFIGYKPIGLFHWFYGCYKLESIEGIEYLNTEDVEITNFMFYNCKYLTSLDLSTFDTSKVSYMVSMFEGCERLTTLNISGFDTSNVTTMRSMFCYCYKLASIDVSGFDTSKVNDMYRMFYHCKFLTSLDLTKFDTSNVSEMRYMFCNCYNLTT